MQITTNKGVMLPLEHGTYSKAVMGDHTLTFNFVANGVLDVEVGDTIVYKGQEMIIRQKPAVTKGGRYSYTIVFEGSRYQLNDMPIMHLGDITFSYFGDAAAFLALVVDNMVTLDSEWQIGTVDVSGEKHLSFDNVTCLEALTKIAEEFNMEWDVNGRAINLVDKVGRDTGMELSYGRGNGLYSITRSPIQNEGIFTRILAYGSTRNLPDGYAGTRLKLEAPLDHNEELYGLKVTTYINDDIFPHRDGTVTATSGLTFTDASMDFDLNQYLMEGVVAKVVFKTGELTGYEFEITRYQAGSKVFTIKPRVESDDYTLPNSTFSINVGDTYTLVDIRMPDEYVAAALLELENAALDYLDKVSVPQVTYLCNIDVLHMKRTQLEVKAGDLVTIIDSTLGINKKIRAQSISYPALFPDVLEKGMQFSVEISDIPTYGSLTSIKRDVQELTQRDVVMQKETYEINRNAVMNLREFKGMVFDPDGTVAQPLIEALSAVFGAESQYFDLSDVYINTNVGGDANYITITAGQLIHYTYSTELGNIWNMAAAVRSDLTPSTAYYISARCSTTSQAGTWTISEVPMSVDSEPGFYHFNLGTLSSVIDGQRMTNITKGFTKIAGGQIDTDTLVAKRLELPLMSIGRNGFNEQRFYYDSAGTKTAALFGIVDGEPKMVWYSESGEEIWNASKNGIIYVTNTPESFRSEGWLLGQSITSESTPPDLVAIRQRIIMNAVRTGVNQAEVRGGVTKYYYDPGANVDTATNAIYQGWHESEVKTTPFIGNGYYIPTGVNPDWYVINNQDGNEFAVPIVKLINGKEVDAFNLNVIINF